MGHKGRAAVCSALCVMFALSGCGDDDRPGSDAGLDGAVSGGDAGAAADASMDGAARDAGPASDGAAAGDAGRADGGGGAGCCAVILCGPGSVCDPAACACVAGAGCCDTGECADPTKYCDFDTCGCIDPPPCEPACDPAFVCDFGGCIPRCYVDGCPDATPVCTDTGACIAPLCTDAECAATSPVTFCDPAVGCYDPCAVDDFTWCTALGGTCVLGTCADASCGASMGGTANPCMFVTDCCGFSYCQHPSDPAPPCEVPCPPGEPVPTADQCVCDIDGYCADLRWGGSTPLPPPLPGGGSGGSGGTPPPPPA